jgi:FMN phosphatase YigB (HAD superfamily)
MTNLSTDIVQPPYVHMPPGMKSAADVDDTVLEMNPDFQPNFTREGVQYVYLCGKAVALNPGFAPSGDICVNLREAVGTLDTQTKEPLGRAWDHQCKVTRELTFEEHLRLQFEDVLAHISVEQAVELAIRTVRPKAGVIEFLKGLRQRDINMVFITNGADAISGPVLRHYFEKTLGKIYLVANKLRDGKFSGLHGIVGVAKGEVVLRLGNVRFFFGDSHGGDGPGAQAVWEAGGYVFAVGHDGEKSLFEYCRQNFGDERWRYLPDYEEALPIVDGHLALLERASD